MPKKERKVSETKKVKKTRKKKLTKKQIASEYLLFAFLLSTVSVLATSLNNYTFPIFGMRITFSIIVFPIIIFVSNYITKKFGFIDSLKSIIISTLIIVAFIILIDDLVGCQVNILELLGQIIGYSVSLVINLSIYYYIISNMEIKKENILIYISYIFTMIINHLLYMLFMSNMTTTDLFWKSFITSIVIESVIGIVLVYFDSKIKRGIEDYNTFKVHTK